MSNTERQRQFRERNPGYYGRLHRMRNAMIAVPVVTHAAVAVEVTVQRREPLMLPAPVETIEIPGVNAIPALLEAPAREAVMVGQKLSVPSAFASFFES